MSGKLCTLLAAAAMASATSSGLAATEDTGVVPVENFVLRSASGEKVKLYENDRDRVATVLAFTSVECPIAKLYAPRLARLDKEYREEGIRFLGINPNIQDSAEEIDERARRIGVEFPILLDSMQAVTDLLKVERTTEVLVLDDEYRIVYRGALDDQYGVGTQKPFARNEYLLDAIEALLMQEQPEVAQTDAPGCLIGRVYDPAQIEVNFHDNIAPILRGECVDCHRPGQVGPMSLMDYDDARGWAPMIAEVVAESRMPPWHASPGHNEFLNERRLTETDKAMLIRWAENGAPEGDKAKASPPPQFEDNGWAIGTPDLIIELEEEQSIPAEGVVDYRYVTVDPKLEEDHWVQAMEVRPTSPEVTHHVLVLLIPPGASTRDALRGDDDGFVGNGYFAVNVPGQRPNIYPEGTAKFLPAGSRFVLQLHYTPNGEDSTDRTQVGFRWAEGPPEHEVKTAGIFNGNLTIKPGDPAAKFTAKFRHDKTIRVLSMFPHMHTRGKSFRYEVIGEEDEVLLDVPYYDFNWQNFYRLKDPVRVEAGDVIYCTAVYDNSADNPFNPDPTKTVRWGDQTFEEMMIGYFDYIVEEEE